MNKLKEILMPPKLPEHEHAWIDTGEIVNGEPFYPGKHCRKFICECGATQFRKIPDNEQSERDSAA
jgi:hypothetical protein